MSRDYPVSEILTQAQNAIGMGATIHQKWTCSHCGSRQTMEEPNKIFESGHCENCGQTSTIETCGFAAMFNL